MLLRGQPGGEEFFVGIDHRTGGNVYIPGKTGSGLLCFSHPDVIFHHRGRTHIRESKDLSQRLVGLAKLQQLPGLGRKFGIHQGGQAGDHLIGQFVQLFLGKFQGLFGLALFEVIEGPDGTGISGPLWKLPQQSSALLQVALSNGHGSQLDGGNLPVGAAARGTDFFQQSLFPASPLILTGGIQHQKGIISNCRVELQGGTVGIAVEKGFQLRFGCCAVLVHGRLKDGIDLFIHLLIGQRFLKLKQGVHMRSQGSCQRAQQRNVRVGIACLPLADRWGGDADPGGQLLLGEAFCFAQGGNMDADIQRLGFHGLFPPLAGCGAAWIDSGTYIVSDCSTGCKGGVVNHRARFLNRWLIPNKKPLLQPERLGQGKKQEGENQSANRSRAIWASSLAAPSTPKELLSSIMSWSVKGSLTSGQ